ncbi:MAG: CRISPR-associated helicase Cas3' [Chloroflexi bacterium]|nr:CRISPR-associated helicase Cas3' [Chloroflexota bacterium]
MAEHLKAVAELSAQFADVFGARDLGYWLGLWHDVGKFNSEFQQYLRGHGGSVDHKRVGARLAKKDTSLFALAIQGHHGGLRSTADFLNWLDDPDRTNARRETEALQLARRVMPKLSPQRAPRLPAEVDTHHEPRLASEFLLRLLFSALVDADHLDTEAHFQPERSERRRTDIAISALWKRFEDRHGELDGQAANTPVNAVRRDIYVACLKAADGRRGFYRLTAPTGAGKTLSCMAFALRHAMKHGLRRVIVVTPFISITEQTAQAYRDAFAPHGDMVLEHHSGAEWRDPEDYDSAAAFARLASENWDGPIIVTTAVQLFESLFANTPARCRKVHRLAGSVLILDEAQALPTHLLEPILDALRLLTTVGRASVVLSTATQPAFESIPAFRELQPIEIVPEPRRHFETLRRVTYRWHVEERWTWDRVADEMRSQDQALAIVNTRADAMDLLDAVDDANALHLSTRLCGAHRLNVIKNVKRRLAAGQPCRLVATQVVEAGVDLDFPLVLRALGPLDSIIQAAGRCNREGRLDECGRVVVFRPEHRRLPGGTYTTATDLTLAHVNADAFDPIDPGRSAGAYFQRLLNSVTRDRARIQDRRRAFDFPAVAREFRMIDRGGEAVAITTYGSEAEQDRVTGWLDKLRHGHGNLRDLRRWLQPWLVSLYPNEAQQYRAQGFLPTNSDRAIPEWGGHYDPMRGLVAVGGEPEDYMV